MTDRQAARARRKAAAPDPAPAPATLDDVMALLRKLEVEIVDAKRMLCPYCGPARLAELHPEKSPKPLTLVAPDAAEHAEHG